VTPTRGASEQFWTGGRKVKNGRRNRTVGEKKGGKGANVKKGGPGKPSGQNHNRWEEKGRMKKNLRVPGREGPKKQVWGTTALLVEPTLRPQEPFWEKGRRATVPSKVQELKAPPFTAKKKGHSGLKTLKRTHGTGRSKGSRKQKKDGTTFTDNATRRGGATTFQNKKAQGETRKILVWAKEGGETKRKLTTSAPRGGGLKENKKKNQKGGGFTTIGVNAKNEPELSPANPQ